MCCQGFLKRVVPFFLTFAAGLFIASFFVTIAAPTFQFKNRGWKANHRQYDRQQELEIQRLREENMRLKNEAQQKIGKFDAIYHMNVDGSVKSIEKMEIDGISVDSLVPPPPPPAPLTPSKFRTETVPYQGK